MILHSLVAVQAYHATQGSRFTGKQGVVPHHAAGRHVWGAGGSTAYALWPVTLLPLYFSSTPASEMALILTIFGGSARVARPQELVSESAAGD
jgi:hypothetical protein